MESRSISMTDPRKILHTGVADSVRQHRINYYSNQEVKQSCAVCSEIQLNIVHLKQ